MNSFFRRILLFLVIPLFLLLIGCAEGYTDTNIQTSYIPAPQSGQATITFFWPTGLSENVTTIIAMANFEGQLSLVGTLGPGERIVQNVSPGEHTYVIGGLAEQVLQANLKAGDYYYVRIQSQWISLYSGFTFVPLTPQMLNAHPDLQIALMQCSVVVPDEKGEEWFQKELKSLQDKLKHPAQILQVTPADGFREPMGGL